VNNVKGNEMKVGAIAYRKGPQGTEICLVSSRRHEGLLTFPKGIVKDSEQLMDAAKRELHEEAGLRGKIKQKSRPFCYHPRLGEGEPVLYYLVKITKTSDKWPEFKQRERIFVTLKMMQDLPLGDAPKSLLRHLNRVPKLRRGDKKT
jgi:8-oxo-dGTP pyrophosphatase MutT (NUDIX family)